MGLSMFSQGNILGDASTLMMNMDPQSMYFTFIPLLVFESGYNSDLFMFKKCLKPILLLAVPGVLLCSLGFGGALYFLGFNSIPISGLFVIGSLLGSTDPIAVSAMLKELGTPKKLSMLIEGESLINDGTSIVCFSTFLQIFSGQQPSIARVLVNLVSLCIGGPVFGLIAGFLFFWWMESIARDGVLLVSLTFANCFLVFFLCEGLHSGMSGILAIVMSSVLLSYKGKIKLHKNEIYHVVEIIWQFAQYVAETFLFLITGLFIAKEFRLLLRENYTDVSALVSDTLKLVAFFFIMNVIRFLVCLVFLPCMNDEDNDTEYKITLKECVVIAYSGIRGAFPLIICLFIARNEDYDVHFRTLTTLVTIVVIAMGLLFNGMTMKFLIKHLDIVKENPISRRVRNLIKREILVKSFEKLRSLKNCKEFQMTNWGLVADLTINDRAVRSHLLASDGAETKSFSATKPGDLKEIFTEIRIRMIFMIKNQIYTHLGESNCSSESATVLLEVRLNTKVCDSSLEDAAHGLSLFYHYQLIARNSYFVTVIEWMRFCPPLYAVFKKKYMIEMSCHYESAYNLKKYISFILQNKKIFALNGVQMKLLEHELRANNLKLDELIEEITAKDSAIIQLYQTKRAATEVLHFKKKYLKKLLNKGCLSREEAQEMIDVIDKCTHRCELFGFTLNQDYLRGWFD